MGIPRLLIILAFTLIVAPTAMAQTYSFRNWKGKIEGDSLVRSYMVSVPVFYDEAEEYTVVVPVEVVDRSTDPPTKRTKFVHETRTRTVKMLGPVDEIRTSSIELRAMREFKLARVSGEVIESDELEKLFAESTVVIELPPGTKLTDELRALLNPAAIISLDASRSSPYHKEPWPQDPRFLPPEQPAPMPKGVEDSLPAVPEFVPDLDELTPLK